MFLKIFQMDFLKIYQLNLNSEFLLENHRAAIFLVYFILFVVSVIRLANNMSLLYKFQNNQVCPRVWTVHKHTKATPCSYLECRGNETIAGVSENGCASQQRLYQLWFHSDKIYGLTFRLKCSRVERKGFASDFQITFCIFF